MNDPKIKKSAVNTALTKSTEPFRTMKPSTPGEPLHPTIPKTRGKRWNFASLIVLISLSVIVVIVYLLRSELAERYKGLGIALCAVAWGGFLVRHLIRMLAEEDKLEEQQFNANQSTVSPLESNLPGQSTNLTTPPPEAGQNIK